MVICAVFLLLISSISLSTVFGVDSYPVTYIIIEELLENTLIFFLLIILFYSGELVWKERDVKLHLIHDALPISNSLNLISKCIALILSYTLLILFMIVAGVIFQASKGYYKYELDVYFYGFFVEIFPFLFLITIVCFFFQVLINHKFLAHLVTLVFLFITVILLKVLGFNHGLYSFGGNDLGIYSDMNGYGHFLKPYIWFKTYWLAFSSLLFIAAIILSVRGIETKITKRWRQGKSTFTKPLMRFSIIAVLVFVGSGAYIFYNTNIINEYSLDTTREKRRVGYEKTLKKFKHLPQPQITDVYLEVALYPNKRSYTAKGDFILTNSHETPISEIHIQKSPNNDISLEKLVIEGSEKINEEYLSYGYTIFTLKKPLQQGESLKMSFKQNYITKGFTERSNISIVYNGTFFDNFHFPGIGYLEDLELRDSNLRKRHGLEPKKRRAKIDDEKALKEGGADGDGEEINFEIVLSTNDKQIAIAPGYLQKQWAEGNRRYFHYKMDKPMLNFYSIVSARYEVLRDQWHGNNKGSGNSIDLEIYYHKKHDYNLDRMMNGMKRSFDYFTKNFGAYQYQQMRIMEFPRYRSFAQSFPNTVPFSEAIGFIMKIDDEKEVDMSFYVTAHEIAHQWWGHQINPANVEGKAMLTETLAQYAALMVMKQEFPEEKVQQLLEIQMNDYLTGRTGEEFEEKPLALVTSGQQYIHYGKGMVTMNTFQDYVSEDSVNIALKRFIRDWDSYKGLKKSKTDRYATTKDLLTVDLFETITLYDNKISEVSYEKVSKDEYNVKLSIDATKYRLNDTGIEHTIPMNDWVDIGIYAKDKNGEEKRIYLKKHKITGISELEISIAQKPSKAGIDPMNKLIDRDIGNNLKSFK